MGRFNPDAAGARERLQTWLDQPGMLGIRMTFYKPQWARWLVPGTIEWFWSDCQRLGIPLMALAPGLLKEIATLAARYPGLTVILDHMARQSALRDRACFADLDELLSLARFPNIAIKASSLPCYTDSAYPFASLEPSAANLRGIRRRSHHVGIRSHAPAVLLSRMSRPYAARTSVPDR